MNRLLLLLAMLLLYAGQVLAHGVSYSVESGAVAVRGFYSDGSPMAFAEATVWPPGRDQEHQQGSTDQHGVFAFLPDREGRWIVILDDGMGHMAEAWVEVDSANVVQAMANEAPAEKLSGTVVGLSLIFGLFGLWSLIRSRGGACT